MSKVNYIVIIFLLTSCVNKKEIFYKRHWNICKLKSETYNFNSELLGNNFSFYDEGLIRLPRVLSQDGKFDGNWQITTKNGQVDSMFIRSDNKVYEGDYKVNFYRNNINSKLFVELKSDSMEIVMYEYFRTKKDRDNFLKQYNINVATVSEEKFPLLEKFPDNRKTFD